MTLKDEPLPLGTITVMPSDGIIRQANIKKDGAYEIADLPPGRATFFVYAENPELSKLVQRLSAEGKSIVEGGGASKGLTPEQAKVLENANLAPKKYSDFRKPLLSHTIRAGENQFDIKLEP